MTSETKKNLTQKKQHMPKNKCKNDFEVVYV